MNPRARSRDGLQIAFDQRGVGEPALLCLPGWCADRFQFSPLIHPLSEARRTLIVDWRGHGESAAAPGDFGYEELALDALAVIEASGVERVVPVAASHAGWVGLELRRRLAERVPGLVCISWMPLGAPPPFLEGLRRMQEPDGWATVRDRLFEMWRGSSRDPGVDEQIGHMRSAPAENWMRAGREIEAAYRRHGSPVAVLGSFEPPPPTLHIYAQPADPAVLEAQQSFAAANPWFSVQRVDAVTHFPQFEAPGSIARLIQEFAAKL